MTIWVITLALEVLLCLWMLYKGHFTRYRILFLSLIFELIAAPVLHFLYSFYGTNSLAYYNAFHIKNFVTILFCFGVIWEGLIWRNRRIRIPYELYLLALFIKFVTEKLQFLLVSHAVYEGLRYSRIAILGWLIFIFRKESPDAKAR